LAEQGRPVKSLRVLCLALLALATTGCVAGNKLQRWEPPGGDIPVVALEEVPVMGAQVEVEAEGQTVRGELLSVDETHFWILREQETTWTPVHRATMSAVHVRLYDTYPGVNAGLMVAGILSTISNGFFLVFTAPLWAVVGSVSIVSASNARSYAVEPSDYNLLVQFARFPQGMPPGQGECPQHEAPGRVPPPAPR
jgi:hypothetical protein